MNDNYKRYKYGEMKGYAAICKDLDEPQKIGSKNKKYHLKELSRYFEMFPVTGTSKFMIGNIHDPILVKNDARTFGNNSIYVLYAEWLIIDLLKRQSHSTVSITKRDLSTTLGLCNTRYFKENLDDEIIDDVNIISSDCRNFRIRNNKRFKDIIEKALDRLTNKEFLRYTYDYMFECVSSRGHKYTRQVTLDELVHILTINQETLIEYECKDTIEAIYRGLSRRYYKTANERIMAHFNAHNEIDTGFGYIYNDEITKVFKAYNITFSPKMAEYQLNEIEKGINKAKLNSVVYTQSNKQAQNDFDRKIQTYEDSYIKKLNKYDEKLYRHRPQYVIAQELLADYLILIPEGRKIIEAEKAQKMLIEVPFDTDNYID